MRLKLLVLATALGAAALPANAQSYNDLCRERRGDNQAAGMILGGILGGVLGSNVAASGHRHDGTAVGAVLGGALGSGIGRGSVNCDTRYYGPNPASSAPPYGYDRYPPAPSTYSTAPGYRPPADYGYYPEAGYGYDSPYDDRRGDAPHGGKGGEIYQRGNDDYIRDGDYAGRDCEDAIQITRLPDGTEVRRSVQACRNAYYGGWNIED